MKQIAMIYASSDNGIIGNKGDLPWNLPKDLQRYQQLTRSNIIIMGRKTYESMGGPLPDRTNLVISSNLVPQAGIHVLQTMKQALAYAESLESSHGTIFIIGGGSIYQAGEPYASTIYRTHVHAVVEGDASFELNPELWQLTHSEEHRKNQEHSHNFTFETYSKIRN